MDDSIIAYVEGVTYANNDGSSRQEIIRNCKKGDELILLRDPSHPYGTDAVKVCAFKKPTLLSRLLRRKPTLAQVGYLSKYVASKVSRLMDEGTNVHATIEDIEQSEKVETTQSGTEIEKIYECLVQITAKNVKWDKDKDPVPSD